MLMNLQILKKLSNDTVRGIRFGLLCFAISLFLYLPFLQKPNFLHSIDELWLNFLIGNHSKETIKDERIVLLFLDKTTKEVLKIKGFLMPSFYLKLLNKLEEMKPKVIAFDLRLLDHGDDPAPYGSYDSGASSSPGGDIGGGTPSGGYYHAP